MSLQVETGIISLSTRKPHRVCFDQARDFGCKDYKDREAISSQVHQLGCSVVSFQQSAKAHVLDHKASLGKRLSFVLQGCTGCDLPCEKIILHDGQSTEPLTKDGGKTSTHCFGVRKSCNENTCTRVVILMTYRQVDGKSRMEINLFETELTLIGVVGIEDPLRPDVPGSIAQCRRAGVDTSVYRRCENRHCDCEGCNILAARDFGLLTKWILYAAGQFAMTGAEFDERVHKIDTSKSSHATTLRSQDKECQGRNGISVPQRWQE